jgi:streptogramin lyase
MSYLYLEKQSVASGQRGIVCGNTFLPIPDRTIISSIAVTDGLDVYADGSSTTANIGTIVCSSQVTSSNGVLVTNSSTDETTGSVQLYGAVTESSATGKDFNGTLCLAVNLSGDGKLVSKSSSAVGFDLGFKVTTEGDPAAAGSKTFYKIYGPNGSDSTTNMVDGSIQRDLSLWAYLFLRASETASDKLDVYLTNNPGSLNKVGEIYKDYLFDVLQYGEEYRYHTVIGKDVFVGSSGNIRIRSLRLYNRRLSDAEMSNLVCELNATEQFKQAVSFTKTEAPTIGTKGIVIDLPEKKINMPSEGLVLYVPFDSNTTTAETGQDLSFRSSGIEFSTYKGVPSISMTRGAAAVSFAAAGLPTGNAPFTISVWFLNPSNNGQESIIIWGPESTGQMVFLNFHNGQLSLDTWFGDTSIDVKNLFSDQWQLLDTVYDGTTLRFYINTILVGSSEVALGTGSASTAYIGGHPSHEFGWSGRLSDLRVYNRALSVSELKTLYGKYHKQRFFLPLKEAEGTPETGTSGVVLNSQDAVLAAAHRVFIPIVKSTKQSTLNRLRSTIVENKGKSYTTEQSWINFPSVNSSEKWIGGVLAKNGKIYCIPHYASEILVIDTTTDTATTIPTESGNLKWFGGCLAPNGKIYAIPHTSSKVLVIDPETNETHTFSGMGGNRKWAGGALGPDGKIYCIPNEEYRIGVIDPETESVETFGNVQINIGYSWKWRGGALGPDGYIYAFPSNYQNNYVLKINPVTRTTQLIEHGLSAASGELFQGCVFDSGKGIFGVSNWFDSLTRYATATGEVSTHGFLGDGTNKWFGGCLAPNGKLYFAPSDNSNILEVDPDTLTTTMLPVDTSHGLSSKFHGAVVAPNGNIYFIPYGSDAVLKLTFNGLTPFEADVCESSWLNKF